MSFSLVYPLLYLLFLFVIFDVFSAVVNNDLSLVWDANYGGIYHVTLYELGEEFRLNNFTTGVQNCPTAIGLSSREGFVAAWDSYIVQTYHSIDVYAQEFDMNGTAKFETDIQVNLIHTYDSKLGPLLATFPSGALVAAYTLGSAGGGGNFVVYAQMFNTSTSRLTRVHSATEFQVNTGALGSQAWPWPSITALYSLEIFAFCWTGLDPTDSSMTSIFAQLYHATNASKLGAEWQVNEEYSEYPYQSYCSISTTNDDTFVIGWQARDSISNYDYDVFANIFDLSLSSIINDSADFVVNTRTTGWQQYPVVANVTDDRFVIVWNSDKDGYAQMFDNNGSSVGSEFAVNTATAGTQNKFRVLGFPGEYYFLIVWQSWINGATPYDTYGQLFGCRFSDTAVAIGAQFRINTYTDDKQQYPCGAMIDSNSNSFVLVWQSEGQDGNSATNYGIYAQRYVLNSEAYPTGSPTSAPTNPSQPPTIEPTLVTREPTIEPTLLTQEPTQDPTQHPTASSASPTSTSTSPSRNPSQTPSTNPSTIEPAPAPVTQPTIEPTLLTQEPIQDPTETETQGTAANLGRSTETPSQTPSQLPSPEPKTTQEPSKPDSVEDNSSGVETNQNQNQNQNVILLFTALSLAIVCY